MKRSHAYYPLFIDLAGRRCVVVGGGLIAERKVATLLSYGARVTVVSPSATARLRTYAGHGRIDYLARPFRASDLRGVWLAYAATNDRRTNHLVFTAASRRRIFTNVVDQPAQCSFIAPAIAKRGHLVIAISTGGASPSLAKHLRRRLQRVVGPEYARATELLGELRPTVKDRLPRGAARQRFYRELLDGEMFRRLRTGQPGAARRLAFAALDDAAGARSHA